ncbi:protein eva-1 isoform X2 [Venturia canescens]|uniref:protein eva-1 isoform X2 n=1 Tax=Venturia canescens TaxID=32260 RepID=UPI001C9BD47E|nr:protein eva-1 isoform X2 [Venturia canescens]
MSAIFVILFLLFTPRTSRADNLGTLKTYQRAACDEETLSLKCPPGTTISVAVARYGKASEAAPGRCSTAKPPQASQINETCLLSKTLQYSLLQIVVSICQHQRNCKFNTSPETFQADPCPGLPKYIEVAYKCRPYEFRSKVTCENEVANLFCNPGKRVAIFSAFYGRTKYESVQCTQPDGVEDETCVASYATETVRRMCHGKRKCAVYANSSTFGEPCKPDSRTYLKIVYTCVPRTVLREQYAGEIEADEIDLVPEFDEGFDRTDFRTEFSPSPNLEGPQPQPRDNATGNSPTVSSSPPRAMTNNERKAQKRLRLSNNGTKGMRMNGGARLSDGKSDEAGLIQAEPNCTTVVYAVPEEERVVVGYLNEWINAYSFISKNQEKFYLYIIVSVAVGVLLFLGLVIGRLLVSRHRAKRQAKFHANNEALPNGFTDEISEIDADIDLTTPVPVPMQDTSSIPETQLAERLHADRYYTDPRMPLSMGAMHQMSPHKGVRVDLGNHMVGTNSLHTILRPENSRTLVNKSYYYG